jgi:hypothetical protein
VKFGELGKELVCPYCNCSIDQYLGPDSLLSKHVEGKMAVCFKCKQVVKISNNTLLPVDADELAEVDFVQLGRFRKVVDEIGSELHLQRVYLELKSYLKDCIFVYLPLPMGRLKIGILKPQDSSDLYVIVSDVKNNYDFNIYSINDKECCLSTITEYKISDFSKDLSYSWLRSFREPLLRYWKKECSREELAKIVGAVR